MTNSCPVCCECKPKFHHPEETHLIKATQPFERINIDFKGPLPSTNKNRYFLNIIDEFSRFPFVFPCPDVSTTTVIKCLTTLFSLFGMPAYVHSDRGASFMSHELRAFLTEKGVAMSRTTSCNPAGNGQVEKYNGTIWKAITMSLKSNNLPIEHWQDVLPDVLHSVRSLLCTATNETPHERFLGFSRRSSAGSSVPTWLATPGPIYVKRNVRNSKTDPLVDEAELLQANPHYAHVRYPDACICILELASFAAALMLRRYSGTSVIGTHQRLTGAFSSREHTMVALVEEGYSPDHTISSFDMSHDTSFLPFTSVLCVSINEYYFSYIG
ncbi:hypothetical protein QZH41_000928, partial [Actinostola sp. cb2023]